MLKQQQALMETEGIQMEFTDAAIREIARVAEEVRQVISMMSSDHPNSCQLAVLCLTACYAVLLHSSTQMALLYQVNTSVDNIGARRLHTVLERIVEEISFDAPEKVGHCAVPLLHDIICNIGSLLASVEPCLHPPTCLILLDASAS